MTFLKLFLAHTLAVVALFLFFNVGYTNAQVGDRPACTNFTCRWGECEQLQDRFLCHCNNGVKGTNCDRLMLPGDEPCASSPCWNNGVCENIGTTDYRCICQGGVQSRNCRTIDTAPCLTNNPCRNNGVCRVLSNTEGVYCFCIGDWTGQFCETRVGLCSTTNPCYNGGVCVDNICQCPRNFTGFQCETYTPINPDKVVKVLNKGWYIANLYLYYPQQLPNSRERYIVEQTGSIAAGQDYAFYIPHSVQFDGTDGVVLIADAVLGNRIVTTRIRADPECFHLYGTTLFTEWSRMPCW